MLKYPATVAAQQPGLTALAASQRQYLVGAAWNALAPQIGPILPTLNAASATLLSQVAAQVAQVAEWIQPQVAGLVPVDQYWLATAVTARAIAAAAALAAWGATGTATVRLTQAASAALQTLQAWDPVFAYTAPPQPAALALTLLQGVTLP